MMTKEMFSSPRLALAFPVHWDRVAANKIRCADSDQQ